MRSLALAVAHVLDVPIPERHRGAGGVGGSEGRMTIRTTAGRPDGSGRLLQRRAGEHDGGPEDAAAVDGRQAGVAVLGDMRELGDYAAGPAFRAWRPQVVDAQLRLLVTVGESTPEIVRGAQLYAARTAGGAAALSAFRRRRRRRRRIFASWFRPEIRCW